MKRILLLCFLSLFAASCSKSKADDNHQEKPINGDEVEPTLINGEEIDKGVWPYVVRIQTGNAGCSATVVGPRVVVTAAHCGSNGATSSFKVGDKTYSGKVTRSSLYPGQDHDVAVIITETEIPKSAVKVFAKITSKAPSVGEKRYLAGYGCIRPGGGGGNDGVLRGGFATITGFSGYDVVSGKRGEAALCFGDSGGPMFFDKTPDKPELAGVNSKGNIRDTNYNTNLASAESKQFFTKIASDKSVEICGINGTPANCGGGPTPPPPPPPPPPPEGCDVNTKKKLLTELAQCLEIPVVTTMGPMYE